MAQAIIRAAVFLTFSFFFLTSTMDIAYSQGGNGKYDSDHDGLIEVSNLEQLDAIRYDLDGDGSPDRNGDASKYGDAFPTSGTETVCDAYSCNGYELVRSLDFDNSGSYASGAVNTAWTTGNGWEPIPGVGRSQFIFDGNGRTISSLYINRIDTYNVGLFYENEHGGVIREIGMVDVDVSGKSGGGLVGANVGIISLSYATGSVSGNELATGGLVGRNGFRGVGVIDDRSTISHSYAAATVSGGSGMGGLVGENWGRVISSYATGSASGDRGIGGLAGYNHGTVISSYATGDVDGSGGAVGGLAGYNWGGKIISSYASGMVDGDGSGVGGLAGRVLSDESESWVIASYATGDVSGNTQVGGLAGSVFNRSDVQGVRGVRIVASYATGEVSGTRFSGGFIGSRSPARDAAAGITVTASYWDTETSGQTAGVGSGQSTGIQGRTTSQLQSPTGYTGIYSTWDGDLDNADSDDNAATGVDDFWDFGTSSQYPALKADLDGDGTPTWQEFGSQRGDAQTYTPPDAPTGLTATAQRPTRITVSWSAPSEDGGAPVTAYDLRYIETGAPDKSDANWTEVPGVWTTGSDPLQYVLTGLAGGTQYDLQVRAVNVAGESEWSATISETTAPPVVPEAPTGLRALAVAGKAEVVLTWTAPANDGGAPITGYKIESSDDGSTLWMDVHTTAGEATGYTDDGTDSNGPTFEAGTTRHYRVSGVNSAGTGPPSKVAITTVDPVARYDANNNGMIERNEVIAAIRDYLGGAATITRADVIRLIRLYLAG